MIPVRVGAGRDVDAALEVWRAGERERSQPPGAARTTAVRTALRSPASLLLVAGAPVVGMLLLELVDAQVVVTMLAVQPAARRQGVARALTDALLARYPAATTWSSAPAVCQALGLVPTGRIRADGAVEHGS